MELCLHFLIRFYGVEFIYATLRFESASVFRCLVKVIYTKLIIIIIIII